VREKEAANYCDYFSPNPVLLPSTSLREAEQRRSLAQGKCPASSAESAKKKFNSLFKT